MVGRPARRSGAPPRASPTCRGASRPGLTPLASGYLLGVTTFGWPLYSSAAPRKLVYDLLLLWMFHSHPVEGEAGATSCERVTSQAIASRIAETSAMMVSVGDAVLLEVRRRLGDDLDSAAPRGGRRAEVAAVVDRRRARRPRQRRAEQRGATFEARPCRARRLRRTSPPASEIARRLYRRPSPRARRRRGRRSSRGPRGRSPPTRCPAAKLEGWRPRRDRPARRARGARRRSPRRAASRSGWAASASGWCRGACRAETSATRKCIPRPRLLRASSAGARSRR